MEGDVFAAERSFAGIFSLLACIYAQRAGAAEFHAAGFRKQTVVFRRDRRPSSTAAAEQSTHSEGALASSVDLAVGNGGNDKFHAAGHLITRAGLRAVVKFRGKIGRVVRDEHGGRRVLKGPENRVLVSIRRNARCRAGEQEFARAG